MNQTAIDNPRQFDLEGIPFYDFVNFKKQTAEVRCHIAGVDRIATTAFVGLLCVVLKVKVQSTIHY